MQDCEQSLFGSKIRGENAKHSSVRAGVTGEAASSAGVGSLQMRGID